MGRDIIDQGNGAASIGTTTAKVGDTVTIPGGTTTPVVTPSTTGLPAGSGAYTPPVDNTTTTTVQPPTPGDNTPPPSNNGDTGHHHHVSNWQRYGWMAAAIAATFITYKLVTKRGDVIRGEVPTVLKVPVENNQEQIIGKALAGLFDRLATVPADRKNEAIALATQLATAVNKITDVEGIRRNDIVYNFDRVITGKDGQETTQRVYARFDKDKTLKFYVDKFNDHKGFRPGQPTEGQLDEAVGGNIDFSKLRFTNITYTPHGKMATNAGAKTDHETKAHTNGMREVYEGELLNIYNEFDAKIKPLFKPVVPVVNKDAIVTVPGGDLNLRKWAYRTNALHYDAVRTSQEGADKITRAAFDKVPLGASNVAQIITETRDYAAAYVQNSDKAANLNNGKFAGTFYTGKLPAEVLGADAVAKAKLYTDQRDAWVKTVMESSPKLYAFVSKRYNSTDADRNNIAFLLAKYLEIGYLGKNPTIKQAKASYIKNERAIESDRLKALDDQRSKLEADLEELANLAKRNKKRATTKKSPIVATKRSQIADLTKQITAGKAAIDKVAAKNADVAFKNIDQPIIDEISKNGKELQQTWEVVDHSGKVYWEAVAVQRGENLYNNLVTTYNKTEPKVDRAALIAAGKVIGVVGTDGYKVNLTATFDKIGADKLLTIAGALKVQTKSDSSADAVKAAIIAKLLNEEANQAQLKADLAAVEKVTPLVKINGAPVSAAPAAAPVAAAPATAVQPAVTESYLNAAPDGTVLRFNAFKDVNLANSNVNYLAVEVTKVKGNWNIVARDKAGNQVAWLPTETAKTKDVTTAELMRDYGKVFTDPLTQKLAFYDKDGKPLGTTVTTSPSGRVTTATPVAVSNTVSLAAATPDAITAQFKQDVPANVNKVPQNGSITFQTSDGKVVTATNAATGWKIVAADGKEWGPFGAKTSGLPTDEFIRTYASVLTSASTVTMTGADQKPISPINNTLGNTVAAATAAVTSAASPTSSDTAPAATAPLAASNPPAPVALVVLPTKFTGEELYNKLVDVNDKTIPVGSVISYLDKDNVKYIITKTIQGIDLKVGNEAPIGFTGSTLAKDEQKKNLLNVFSNAKDLKVSVPDPATVPAASPQKPAVPPKPEGVHPGSETSDGGRYNRVKQVPGTTGADAKFTVAGRTYVPFKPDVKEVALKGAVSPKSGADLVADIIMGKGTTDTKAPTVAGNNFATARNNNLS